MFTSVKPKDNYYINCFYFIFTFLPIVREFCSILLAVMMDVVFPVNSERRIAPANIQKMQRIRAKIDLGVLSPYLKHGKIGLLQ